MILTTDESLIEQASLEVTDWLQKVWQMMEDGTVDKLRPQPKYSRRHLLTAEVIGQVVHFLEETVFQYEIDNYPGYHNEQQGIKPGEILISPQFTKLGALQQRALVEEYDRIMQQYRDTSGENETVEKAS